MSYLLRVVRNTMAVVGAFLVFGGVSTSDYYVIELGQTEPAYVWSLIWIGIVLLIPAFIHLIRKHGDV